jgi:hypothetical protein
VSRRAGQLYSTGCQRFILRLVSPLGGTLELAQQIAAHESTPTAKLHDRTAAWSRSRKWNAAKSEVVHYIQPVLARIEV